MTKGILVPVSATENITSISEHARKLFQKGKLSYEKFCNIEMIELGYDPSNPEDVKEYDDFIESLSDNPEDFVIEFDPDNPEDFVIEFESEIVFGPIEGEVDRLEVQCTECGTIHWVSHTEWEALVCLSCDNEMSNPYNNKGKE